MSDYNLSPFAPTHRPSCTAKVLAVAALVTGGFGSVGVATAQDCVGNYRMLKDQIPVVCDEVASPSYAHPLAARALYAAGAVSAVAEPVHSGSSYENADAMCSNGMRGWETPYNGVTTWVKCEWDGAHGSN